MGGSGGLGFGVRVDGNEELKFCENSRKKNGGLGRGRGGSGWGRVGGRVGGQGGCERRIEVFVRIQKNNFFGTGGSGGRVWGVRVDVNEELKF